MTQTDFGETYAPVSKLITFRLLTSLVAKRSDWTVDHLDVVTTFLNPEIDHNNIYMELPEGWPFAGRMVRLNKALYLLERFIEFGITLGLAISSIFSYMSS